MSYKQPDNNFNTNDVEKNIQELLDWLNELFPTNDLKAVAASAVALIISFIGLVFTNGLPFVINLLIWVIGVYTCYLLWSHVKVNAPIKDTILTEDNTSESIHNESEKDSINVE